MKNIIIMGFGQIGQSVYHLYRPLKAFKDLYTLYYIDVKEYINNIYNIRPLKAYEKSNDVDVLHVCIPYTDEFNSAVSSVIREYNPKITLIHSTTDIGATRELWEETRANMVHTPVMGIHPSLTESMLTFKKIVGGINEESNRLAKEHLEELKITPEFFKSPEESEAAKLLETSYYGTIIRYMQEVHEFCDENNLNFDHVYTRANEIYNKGYSDMGMKHVIRPILKYGGKGIGGHCIMPNAEILKNKTNKTFVKYILEAGKSSETGGFAAKEEK